MSTQARESDEALYYEKTTENKVRCQLCPHNCLIMDGKAGNCRVRINRGGNLFTRVHGRVTAISMDPIEKKPLFHFYPGSKILSIGTAGCNFHCSFCQNWDISQNGDAPTREVDVPSLLRMAKEAGSIGIAFTYSEPVIWIETVLEIGAAFRRAGLKNVLVTNGFINKKPLKDLLPLVDAMNIDVKGFTEFFYRKNCLGKFGPVKENVEYLFDKTHVELTTLVIPGLNDSEAEIDELCRWVASMDKEIPVHFSRYHPSYEMTIPQTPEKTLKRIYQQAKRLLKHVYVGNILIPGAEDTLCPHCNSLLVKREYFNAEVVGMKDGTAACRKCGEEIKRILI